MGHRCLFCYADIEDERGLIKSEKSGLKHSSSPVLEQQIKVIFILRKLLEIPEVKLISFLEDWGNNPSEWIRLCQRCEEIVENAREIYGEILEVQRRFRGVQQKIIEVTKGRCDVDDGGGGRKGRRKQHGRRAISKDSIQEVTEECRAIIKERTQDQCSMLVDNPFIEGDLLAETTVVAGQCTATVEDDILTPVKQEVIFEDESESILPSDHFDSSTEFPAQMELGLNSENEDDNDDEWLPDPLESISSRTKSPRSKVSQKCQDTKTTRRRRQLPQKRKIIKRKVSTSSLSASDSSALSEEDEEGTRSNAKSTRKSPKLTITEQGYTRKDFQEILKIVRGVKEGISRTQSIMFCPHCNKFPFKVHQLAKSVDHMGTCPAASDNCYDTKKCPVCNLEKFKTESSPVTYVEHITSCNGKDANDDDGNCLIPLENRLFKCTTCGEDEQKWMQVDDFLEHYIHHIRYRFKCTECSHRFVTDNCQDTHYHYKAKHPDNLADPTDTRCTFEPKLPEVCWWCPVCSEKFCDDDERNIHFDQHHDHHAGYSDLQANKDKYVCELCSRTYFCADELRYHQGTRHVYDERKRVGKTAPKKERAPRKPPGRKPNQNKTKRSYADDAYSKLSSSMRSITVATTKPVTTLSSSDFFTKLQFKQFLSKHFRQLNYGAEFSKQSNYRLFPCNLCPDKVVMDLASFLDHYLFHKRQIFKCTKCSHRFPSNENQDTGYHYKTVHPEHLKEPRSTRCVEDAVLPELIWVCFYCKEEYSSEHLRDNHVETQHQDKQEKSELCQFCSKKYSTSEELLIHIGTTHVIVEKFRNDRRILSSSDFFTKLQFKQILKKHFTQQSDAEFSKSNYNKLFTCNICPDMEAMNLATFLDHYLFHRRNIFKCTKCSHRFPSNESQDTSYHYRKIHHEQWKEPPTKRCVEDAVLPEMNWICIYCKGEYSNEHLRDSHVETEHPDKLSEEKLNLCQLCPNKYSSSVELLIHVGTTHVRVEKLLRYDKRFKCNECLETFERWSEYENHCRKVHKAGDDDKNEDGEFRVLTQAVYVICDVCGKKIKHSYLKEHLVLHRRTKKFICEVPGCGEAFTKNEYLSLHKFRKHEIRDPAKNPLVCPYCPFGEKVLHNRPYLRKHIQAVHHKTFNIQCDMCGKGFLYKSQLMKHLSRIHNIGIKGEHKCPVEGCGKIFFWKKILQDHLNKHNGKPKFNCSVCGKGFYFKNQFVRHEMIHKNAETKPYKCEICPKRFPVRNYLYIHMKSHKRKGEAK